MRCRIKIITYRNNRTEYFAQVKSFFGWKYLNYAGQIYKSPNAQLSREESLKRIDLHCDGNSSIRIIEFEYVDK